VVRVAVTPPAVISAVAGRSTTTCLLHASCTLIPVIRQGVGFLIQLFYVLWEQLGTFFSNYRFKIIFFISGIHIVCTLSLSRVLPTGVPGQEANKGLPYNKPTTLLSELRLTLI